MLEKSPFVGSPYEWDVFVSYSHGKTALGKSYSQLRAWTTAFVHALTEDLHYALNSPPPEANSTARVEEQLAAESVR